MSTLSSSLNSSATALLANFYKPLTPGRTGEHYLLASKWMTAIFGIAQMGVALGAYWLHSERSVIDQVLAVAGLTIGLILGVFLIGTYFRSIAPRAVLIGLVVGLVVVLGVWALSEFRGHMPEPLTGFQVAWPWFAPLGAATTIGMAIVVNFLGIGNGPTADRSAKSGIG
jgi:Na+/proline symporter